MTPARLLLTLMLAMTGCGDSSPEAPAAPATPPPPKVDINALRAKAAQEIAEKKEALREELRVAGTATLKKKKKVREKLELEFTFVNNTEKVMMRADGTLHIRDESGKLIKNLKLTFAQEIKPGKTGKKRGRFPVDPTNADAVTFAKTPLSKLKIEWMPRLYRFEDGSTMIAE